MRYACSTCFRSRYRCKEYISTRVTLHATLHWQSDSAWPCICTLQQALDGHHSLDRHQEQAREHELQAVSPPAHSKIRFDTVPGAARSHSHPEARAEEPQVASPCQTIVQTCSAVVYNVCSIGREHVVDIQVNGRLVSTMPFWVLSWLAGRTYSTSAMLSDL